jgi:hypothetical protein
VGLWDNPSRFAQSPPHVGAYNLYQFRAACGISRLRPISRPKIPNGSAIRPGSRGATCPGRHSNHQTSLISFASKSHCYDQQQREPKTAVASPKSTFQPYIQQYLGVPTG